MGKCEDCKFWDHKYESWGFCRRSAPKKIEDNDWGEWPGTDRDDWCGEFQQKEKE